MDDIIYAENIIKFGIKAFFTGKNFNISNIYKDKEVYLPIQMHTDRVMILSNIKNKQVADAIITNQYGLLIGIKVADCLPILLYDPVKEVIGAVHAGWRSTSKGILKKTIGKMRDCFNCSISDILIAMGPSIRGCCYEVGNEVIDALNVETPNDKYIISVNGKIHADLAIANQIQALISGIREENIWISMSCTFCNHDIFASYRREGKNAGRQYGIIGML